ncbi:hypothetical protein AX15_002019 [Amanita polypyramis BW_CC]|nr:hypothetical protein AX15_002019 [Amanita polypyramis BW_CC]
MFQWVSCAASALVITFCMLPKALAYDNFANSNLVLYWGQNSYGAANPTDTARWQKNLGTYCQDDAIDVVPLAFLNAFFSTGDEPEINFANICNSLTGVFPGTNLANCRFMASDIKACQTKGKIVTISLGGASGAATFNSNAQGQAFAQKVWDLFLGGSSGTRPFGNAVLDGIDLDIEGGGSAGFFAFVTQLRSLMTAGSKQYYITAAPQCPFPDANLGSVLNAVSFDAVYVQFYNNYCGNNNPSSFNFATWDKWAKSQSPNPNVKVYLGAPASFSAAGFGYVDAATLGNLAVSTRSQYSSFGGVMLWDASQAYANNRYHIAVKNALISGSGNSSDTMTTTTVPTTITTTTSLTSSIATPTSCVGVAPWSSGVTYNGGSWVTYNEYLWTNWYWSYNDVPGGTSGIWANKGPCTATNLVKLATNSATVMTKHG